MTTNNSLLEKINEIDFHTDSDDDLEEINEKLRALTKSTSNEMSRLKKYIENVNHELNDVRVNTSFEEQELIEEQIDIFIYEYHTLKQLLKQGREIRIHKEAKEKELTNQKRFARNLLVHYGIPTE
jgi:PAS domain-containing protein